MRMLSKFTNFDLEGFLKDKVLMVTDCAPLEDYVSKKVVGSKIEVTIFQDKTEYPQVNGRTISNRFEKFNIKVHKSIDIPLNSVVVPVNGKGSVYGDFKNQLSVTADDVKIVQTQQRG